MTGVSSSTSTNNRNLNIPSSSATSKSATEKCNHRDISLDSGIDGSRSKSCNCQTQSLFFPTNHGKLCISSKLKLHAQELSIIGLPIYNSKRSLVERVVEGVAEIVRGAPTNVLITALESLLSDGLNNGLTCWDMIDSVTAPGPATSNVYQLVKDLGNSEKPKNSRTQYLFKELLRFVFFSLDRSYVKLFLL